MGYSASHVIYLYCEQSECKNTLEAFGDSFKACLEMAKDEGWKIIEDWDLPPSNKGTGYTLCPQHRQKIEKPRATKAKSKHQSRVESFMFLAGQDIPKKPILPSLEIRKLRAELILEEARETIQALGFDMVAYELYNAHQASLVDIIDGCADLSVVTTGTLSACGIPDLDLLRLVDENNLSKFAPGYSINDHGKLIKPPGHVPPDFEGFLKKLGYDP